MSDKIWDVFISHASEDKDSIARPLWAALSRGGVRAWFDEHELKIGDRLSEKIDHGLASSRFGIVVLSPAFLSKQWPKTELSGLRALEADGKKVILPVWHNVDKATVARSSPVLADLVAFTSSQGIQKVAAAILDIVFAPGNDSPSYDNPTLSRRLIELLARHPDKGELIAFLKSHSRIVGHMMRSRTDPIWNIEVRGTNFDAVVLANLGTTRGKTLHFVSWLPIWNSPFRDTAAGTVSPHPLLSAALESASVLRGIYERGDAVPELIDTIRQLADRANNIHEESWVQFADKFMVRPVIEFTCFAGRREYVDATEATANAWRDLRISHQGCRLRTYDGLIEGFQQIEYFQQREGDLGPWDFTS